MSNAVTLDRLLLAQIAKDWRELNGYLFKGLMTAPIFLLLDSESALGRWTSSNRTLALARRLIEDQPWGVVKEVLKHEMAHQYCDEVMRAAGEGPHGPTFKKVCAALGIDGASRGLPPAAREESDDRILARIRRLLALAESSNEHEAQAAMNAAQRLMLKHNIELATQQGQRYSFRDLGQPTGRVQAHVKLLAGLLTSHFFVQGVWVECFDAKTGAQGTVFEVMGTPENVEIAAYVYDFMLLAAERAWQEHKRALKIRADADRRRFLSGVMMGFREKLAAQKVKAQEEGLVWVGDADLDRYLHARFPRLQSGRGVELRGGAAYGAGKEAGKSLVLHRGVSADAGAQGRMISSKP